ncbi:MAG: head-tail connector protein [Methanobrevibacter sp.]|nr:head-tail connector protein [Methanobrevibacter sp.]
MENENKVKELLQRFEQLKENRTKFHERWTEAQTYVDNSVLSWTTIDTLPEVPKRHTSSPYSYCKTLVSGIFGYAISPSLTWFKLSLNRNEYLALYGVKDFLEDCEKIMLAAFNRSNFYKNAVPVIKDCCILGHGALFIDDKITDADKIRFTKFPANELYFDINEFGEVDTVFRWYQDTVKNVINFFGEDKLSDNIKEKYKQMERWNDKIDILQAIFPRKDFKKEFKDAKNKPIACVYIDLNDNKIIDESGYDDFPYSIFEWERFSGYAYSSSPAQDAMPDIKALNIIKKTSLKIAQKSANPSYKASDDVREIDTSPEGVTYLPAKDSIFEPVRSGENYPITLQELANYEQAIKDWFFVDYFLALQNRQGKMTATEVEELQGEKAATLSTFIVNLNDFLSSVIERTFNLLMRNGLLPDIPESLLDTDAEIKIDFVGPLAQAQKKYHTMGGTLQALNIVGPILNLFPNAGDFIDGDELMKSALEGQGMPQNIIREDDDVKKIREDRAKAQAEQQAQQQRLAMTQSLMQNANKMNEAPQEGSLLQGINEQLKGGTNGL